jgi:hypothetical protein
MNAALNNSRQDSCLDNNVYNYQLDSQVLVFSKFLTCKEIHTHHSVKDWKYQGLFTAAELFTVGG